MRVELHESDYHKIRPLFTGVHLVLLTDAVVQGRSPARIWVDEAHRPRTALLWDKGGCYCLAGDAENAEFNADVAAFAGGQIVRGFSYFKIYYTSDEWEKAIPTLFQEASPVKRDRQLHVLRRAGNADWREKVPAGFRVQQIDAALLRAEDVTYADRFADEIRFCWNSIEDFLSRGFGYVVLHGHEIVCWCTAECVSERRCGIGIETIGQYQGRGLATLAASAFVEHALARQVTPHWDAWTDNAASLAVARKVGFEKLLDYSVYRGRAS
jgi:RimJ/RimL family protein N-acetyltransferase